MAQSQNQVLYAGYWWEPKIKYYSVDVTRAGVIGSVAQGSIQIDSSSPFVVDELHAEDSTDTTNVLVQQFFAAQARDNESGYNWSEGWATRSAFFGQRGIGRMIPGFQVMRGSTIVIFSIKDLVATAGTTTVTLQGRSLMQREKA
jgi:hypothetical protein